MKKNLPIIGITMGDPAGIGPEITLKAFLRKRIFRFCKPILIGDLGTLERVSWNLGLDSSICCIPSPAMAYSKPENINLINLDDVELRSLKIGAASIIGGRASVRYIEKAVELALAKDIDGITTAPINKQAIRIAGSKYIDHTEMISDLCDVENPLLMFKTRKTKIFFLTRHISLAEAVESVKKDLIVVTTLRINEVLRKFGVCNPLIAIAALNPHSSDGGLIGYQETQEIIPSIKELKIKKVNVVGPVPADTIFQNAFKGQYDAVLSMYHDQGHIAAKIADFKKTVTATLGLPFIRTSVDHGTAYDIAGKGLADPTSLEEAIIYAAELSKIFSKNEIS